MRASPIVILREARSAVESAPYFGAALLVDAPCRPGEAGSDEPSSMLLCSFVLPRAPLLRAIARVESRLAPEFTRPAASVNLSALGLLLGSAEGLQTHSRADPAFAGSSAAADVHASTLWRVSPLDGSAPLVGCALSFYGSGYNGFFGERRVFSRDGFEALWSIYAADLAQRLRLANPPRVACASTRATALHQFARALPDGLAASWTALAQEAELGASSDPGRALRPRRAL